MIEGMTGRSIIQRTYRLDLPKFAREIVLPKPPIIEIVSLQYYNTDSPQVLTTLDAGNYRLDAPGFRVLTVSGVTFPAVSIRHDAVQVTYRSGYVTQDSPEQTNAPLRLIQAMKLAVSDFRENTESQSQLRLEENKTFMNLISPFRIW